MNFEQIKQIAEYMEDEILKSVKVVNKTNTHDMPSNLSVEFNPLADKWNHKVFKALVDECNKRDFYITIASYFKVNSKYEVIFTSEFNNEEICLAYIAVMESK